MMTGKERMLTAIRGGKADRVPVCPDISNMIPCRLTGRTFERIYLHHDPPLGRAYADAVRYFGFDGWYWYWSPTIHYKSRHGVDPTYHCESRALAEDRYDQTIRIHTSLGTLQQRYLYYPADPPTLVEKFIKNIERDLPIVLKWLDADIVSVDWSGGREDYDRFGGLGVWGLNVLCPGPQFWIDWFDGGLQAVIEAIYDYPDLMDELFAIQHRRAVEMTERFLSAPFPIDFLMIGASGLLTLSNPQLFRKYALPTIAEFTRMCKSADMPTMVHACGKSKLLLETFVRETELNCLNPLEKPPMGDVELSEARRIAGNKVALMGNLHTTDVMLRGRPEDVVRESQKAIDDAGRDGGFILSTGDQCGRDTPDENIRAMIRTAHDYGKY